MNQSSPSAQDSPVNQSAKFESRIAPWLTCLAYPLGSYLVIPLYFGAIKVTGQENIPRTGPVILAPTHRSRWDALIVPYATGKLVSRRELRVMVSANELYKGIQGWFIQRLGGFPVDTERPGISSVRHSVELLCEGEMIVIFPEGNIFRENRVHSLKRGVPRIALETELNRPGIGVKILPISVAYSQPYPTWGTDVTVKIGRPIEVAKYDMNAMKESTQQLTNDLHTALKILHEEPIDGKS